MKRLMMCTALALLAGCGVAPMKCEPPQVVKVPVSVGCLGDEPEEPADQVGAGAYPGDALAAKAALIDAAAWRGYAAKLKASQAGCDKRPAGQ
jgi:hypothetical protein